MFWNPVFQRRLIRKRLEPAINAAHTFWVGFIVSFMSFGWGYEALRTSNNIVNYIILGLIGVSIATIAIRLFWTSVILTVNRMKDLLTDERKDPILTTPMTDPEIFYGECVGNVMKGHLVFEATIGFVLGIVAPYIIILLLLTLVTTLFSIKYGLMLILYAVALLIPVVWMIFMSATILLMLAFAAGFYAILTDNAVAIMLTIIHTAFFVAIGAAFVSIPFFIGNISQLAPNQMLTGFGGGALFQVCWMLLCAYGTGWMGLRAFSLSRRPGYYELDKITAFDQV